MQQHIDTSEMLERVGEVAKEIRKSEAYPALIGGIAGGVAGALVAAIIAGRRPPPKPSTADDGGGHGRGWSLRDLVQLATVVATLAKQVQAWMKEQEKPK